MRGYLHWTLMILVLSLATACAPRQLKPVATIDPGPLLDTILARQAALEKGLSGTLELSYKNHGQRFNGRVFIVARPDGRFRLEVPGPFGGTHLVMVSDNTDILAFYPGKGQAYHTTADGKSINPHLPFPLPVEPARLAPLVLGALPQGSSLSGARAHLMNSGEKILQAETSDGDFQYSWLFGKTSANRLDAVTIRGIDIKVSVRTAGTSRSLLRDFNLKLPGGILKGEWDTVSPFTGDRSAFGIDLPGNTTVTDLEAYP